MMGDGLAAAGAGNAAVRLLDAAEVRAIVDRYLAAQLDPTGDRWRLGAVQLSGDATVPTGGLDIALSHGAGVELAGPTILHLRVSGADGSVRRLRVRAVIEREAQVVLATRNLSRGDTVAEGDAVAEYRSLRSLPRDSVRRLDEAVGKQLVRPISAGAVVRAGLLTQVPVVSRGAQVVLVAAQGGLRITTPGIAKEDGGAGEIVRVVNAMSGKVVNGRVIDAETVEVTF
jgi:flagella basal body P-ring formation protein FlgA